MVEKNKKRTISEDDISTLLQSYEATTVLTLLQEVAQIPDVKIDWNALVKKTSTGISNVREYQMLWRHLAYRHTLVERLDDGAEPLDDDSDLDYELEALPPVKSEAVTEAAACVKVLIASGLQSDTSLSNGLTVEAPLTINIPNAQSSRAPLENSQLKGTNITIPVSVQKQPLPTLTSGEGLDANRYASGNLPSRKKIKRWSPAEDLELIAAVQKCGEGNWANMSKEDFKGDRSASQLSQRWAKIRKQKGNVNVGGGSQLSEAQLAARRAVSLALNMPMVDNLTAACSNAGANPNTAVSNSSRFATVEASSVGAQPQHLSRQDFVPSTKPALSLDAMVKAAAVAAGARIATPSDAASLFKAAQAKNAVHIIPRGGSLIRSSTTGNANALPSNVHFIHTGLSATPTSTYPTSPTNSSQPSGTQQSQSNSPKLAAQTIQLNSTRMATESNLSAEVTNVVVMSSLAIELEAFDALNSHSCNPPKEHVQDSQVGVSGNAAREQVQEAQAVISDDQKEGVQNDHQASDSGNAPKEEVQEDQTALSS